jgi:hypothetical protein
MKLGKLLPAVTKEFFFDGFDHLNMINSDEAGRVFKKILENLE